MGGQQSYASMAENNDSYGHAPCTGRLYVPTRSVAPAGCGKESRMLRKVVPNVLRVVYWRQLASEFVLLWHIVRDRRVPLYLKAIPALAALYLLLPVDLVPDWIPVLGQLDDLAILALA